MMHNPPHPGEILREDVIAPWGFPSPKRLTG